MKAPRPVKAVTKVLGFEVFSVVLMWFVFMGAFMGFALARMQYYSRSGLLQNLAPYEAYWYSQPLYYAGMELHIAGAFPAAIIMFFQFIPGIRKHAINVHKWMGRLCFILMLAAIVGAGTITRHAFGGTSMTQSASISAGFLLLICMAQGYVNIKRKLIQEHCEWMLRASAVAGSIFTMRLMLLITTAITSNLNSSGSEVFYETCPMPTGAVAVPASISESFLTATSLFRANFGAVWWISIVLHGVLVEIWIVKRYRPLGKDLPHPAIAPAPIERQEANVID